MAELDPDYLKWVKTITLDGIRANTKREPAPFPPVDDEFCESHVHPTPNGGDYSTAYFYDKDGNPCRREEATYMNIVEYKKGGERVNESYGEIGH